MNDDTDSRALDYHRYPTPGKLRIEPTKRMVNQSDLALAYSPGVAAACREIVKDPGEAASLTVRANLVAVVTNGTAVLGLGPIGPLAAKPVMEGKAVLFKRFAGIDVFDIELDERDPQKLIDIIASLEPTFGAINLEDIKAPECFEVERGAQARMGIPVFHDDQHGTAICVAAAVTNGLELAKKKLADVKIVCSGAGAAALACLDLLVAYGAKIENITVCDIEGVVYQGRKTLMDPYKARYAQKTRGRTLADVLPGADIFLGLSAGNVLKPEWLKTMGPRPLILALANPTPEIHPELAKTARPDAIIATGRSDFPNQVNNVLCFPFIFRGALDVGAKAINLEMRIAAAKAIAALARAEPSDVVARAYRGENLKFGPNYILPKPFDPRLITVVAPAVAEAAIKSNVAARPLNDLPGYRRSLEQFVYKTGHVMEPLFVAARVSPRRVIYAEGEDARVLRAVQIAVNEGLAHPILVGRHEAIEIKISELGLTLKNGTNIRIVDPEHLSDEAKLREVYLSRASRKGVTPAMAETWLRARATVLGAVLLAAGEGDALICGVSEPFSANLRHIQDIVGTAPGIDSFAAMRMVVLNDRFFFVADTNVTYDPTAEQIAQITVLAAREMKRLGISPHAALVCHASFGSSSAPTAVKMRRAHEILTASHLDFPFDGEMSADAAMIPEFREELLPGSALKGTANLLVMPNLDTANVACQLAWSANGGLSIGPILLGTAQSAHIVPKGVTVRGIVNMTALAVIDAQDRKAARKG